MSKHPGGRPLFDGKDVDVVISKLEQGFAKGFTDVEACLYAGISTSALFRYIDKHPSFGKRKEELKDQPKMMAKDVIVSAIADGDKQQANWYLERKDPEFTRKNDNNNKTELNIKGLSMEQAMELDLEELEKIANS